MQLAGVRAMGDRLLSRGKHPAEDDQDREVVARGNEKLHREATGLQRALDGEIRIVDGRRAKAVAGSSGGFCSRIREIETPNAKILLLTFRRPSRVPSGTGIAVVEVFALN